MLVYPQLLCYTDTLESGSADPWKEVKRNMKQEIHQKYHTAKVTCACGNTFETGSTSQEIKVEICSQCHPFFTGKQRTVYTKGRVERFKSKYGME